MQTQYERSCMTWGTSTLRDTTFDPRSEIGQGNVLTIHVRFAKWH